jgi:hypothetical protein
LTKLIPAAASIAQELAGRDGLRDLLFLWGPLLDSTDRLIGNGSRARSALGAYPDWVQEDDTPPGMDFLAQIDSEVEAELEWGDTGCLYLFHDRKSPGEFKMRGQCC